MVLMPYSDLKFDEATKQQLLTVAKASITYGLTHHRPSTVTLSDYSPALQQLGASFVTLEKQGELRGCIGSLEAHRPLLVDIAENAFAAAFQDPRFPPLQEQELNELEVHISLLTSAEPFPIKDEADLLRQLNIGIDGLILQEGRHRATFLPSVWESLPDPKQFLAQLKLKAGLPSDYWSSTLSFERYQAKLVK